MSLYVAPQKVGRALHMDGYCTRLKHAKASNPKDQHCDKPKI